ncbi:MAG: tetraacyldisaccharide 4'-kinase [Betaproteobacteria bacterium]|nr:tetraacyldisaccharide 4'-kinase [Betaproteobacteria bacterium]
MKAWLEARLAQLWWRASPGALSWALWPLSLLYDLLRRLHGRSRQTPALPMPVLVVGNLIVGGAGKTPTVIAVVQALQARGHRPGVISRGHGRQGRQPRAVQDGDSPSDVGDEPLLLLRRCKVPVWVGADRNETGRQLCAAQPQVDVLVSDDGLQHRRLARQAVLVVFDERGAGNGLLLPAGPLREPLPAALPADWRVLYTAGHPSTALPGALATRRLAQAWPLAAWHAADDKQALALTALRGRPLLAAAGLAAPQKFFDLLAATGLQFKTLPLPDHHPYDTLPWPSGSTDVLVTEKDAVKLDPARMGGTRVWVLPLDFDIPAALVDELSALLFVSPAPHLP